MPKRQRLRKTVKTKERRGRSFRRLIKEIQSEKKAIFRGRITIKKIGENEN